MLDSIWQEMHAIQKQELAMSIAGNPFFRELIQLHIIQLQRDIGNYRITSETDAEFVRNFITIQATKDVYQKILDWCERIKEEYQNATSQTSQNQQIQG